MDGKERKKRTEEGRKGSSEREEGRVEMKGRL